MNNLIILKPLPNALQVVTVRQLAQRNHKRTTLRHSVREHLHVGILLRTEKVHLIVEIVLLDHYWRSRQEDHRIRLLKKQFRARIAQSPFVAKSMRFVADNDALLNLILQKEVNETLVALGFLSPAGFSVADPLVIDDRMYILPGQIRIVKIRYRRIPVAFIVFAAVNCEVNAEALIHLRLPLLAQRFGAYDYCMTELLSSLEL